MSLFTNISASSSVDARVRDLIIDGSVKQFDGDNLVSGGLLFGKVYGVFEDNIAIPNGDSIFVIDEAGLINNVGDYLDRPTGVFSIPPDATLMVQCRFNLTKGDADGALSVSLIDGDDTVFTANTTPVIVNGETLVGALFNLMYVNITEEDVNIRIQFSCPAGTAELVGNANRSNNFVLAQIYA